MIAGTYEATFLVVIPGTFVKVVVALSRPAFSSAVIFDLQRWPWVAGVKRRGELSSPFLVVKTLIKIARAIEPSVERQKPRITLSKVWAEV